MAIGSALERGSLICVYDEDGRTLFQKARGNGPNDGLLGFTNSTVTVRLGHLHVRRTRHDDFFKGSMIGRRCRRCVVALTDTVWPSDEAVATIDEAAMAQNHDLIEAIMNAEVSAPVMSLDAFKEWLDQQ